MKKLMLGMLLLAAPVTTQAKRVDLDSTLLKLVDGTEYIGIGEIFNFAGNIINLLHGAHLKTALQLQKAYGLHFPEPIEEYVGENGKVGMIWFRDHYATMKELAEYEQEHPEDPELIDAIERACGHFEKFSEDYVEEIETAKDIMIKIIANWAKLRERPDSMMLDWSEVEGQERDSLYKTMTTFEVFDTFLEDLLLFLKDLVQNCPKSHKYYRESLKKQE